MQARVARMTDSATARKPLPEDGKVFLMANPWPLAAEAKRRGYETDRFRESDFVPDGQMIVCDLDALRLPDDWSFDVR